MDNAYREDFFLIHENTGRLNSYSKQKTRIEQSYHDYKVNEKEAAHIYINVHRYRKLIAC